MINFIKFFKFGLISFIGLCLDLLTYFFLIKYFLIFVSNIVSSGVAVSTVYFLTSIFISDSKKSILSFILWILYQVINILFFSYLLFFIDSLLNDPILSKIILIPFSFLLNFLVINFLLRKFV